MKKEIMIFSLLVLVISMTSTSFVNGKENQGIEQQPIQNDSGIIYGLSHVYYKLSSYKSIKYGVSWSFSGVSDSIDVWLFQEYEYYKFADGQACEGYHLCDADDNYVSKSGKIQIPDYFTYYLVYYNPHILRISYSDISCSVHEIHLQIDSVTFTPIDNDNDGFDDRLRATVDISFNTNYWTEGGIVVRGYLYDEEGKIEDERGGYQYIENDETISFDFQIHGGTGQYTAKIKAYFFLYYGMDDEEVSDDTFESTESYKLYGEGQLYRLLMWIGIGAGGAIVILIITILVLVSMRRKKRTIIQHVEDSQPIQKNLCPNCKNEIVETGHKFCEHCGEAL